MRCSTTQRTDQWLTSLGNHGTSWGTGTRDGLLGGINAVIVGNYLTTLGRDPSEDLALLDELEMPIKALNETF